MIIIIQLQDKYSKQLSDFIQFVFFQTPNRLMIFIMINIHMINSTEALINQNSFRGLLIGGIVCFLIAVLNSNDHQNYRKCRKQIEEDECFSQNYLKPCYYYNKVYCCPSTFNYDYDDYRCKDYEIGGCIPLQIISHCKQFDQRQISTLAIVFYFLAIACLVGMVALFYLHRQEINDRKNQELLNNLQGMNSQNIQLVEMPNLNNRQSNLI